MSSHQRQAPSGSDSAQVRRMFPNAMTRASESQGVVSIHAGSDQYASGGRTRSKDSLGSSSVKVAPSDSPEGSGSGSGSRAGSFSTQAAAALGSLRAQASASRPIASC